MPQHSAEPHQKPVEFVPIPPPPAEQRRSRAAGFVEEGGKRDRYFLPSSLESGSPVGYRRRLSLTADEAIAAMQLLSLQRPLRFVPGPGPTDQELFEESALGVLSARQSTNYRGHEQVTLGPDASQAAANLLRRLPHLEGRVLDGASHTHVVLSKPYRTPFTMLLTFIGHAPVASLATVPMRAWRKKYQHADDIPTIGYLQHLHVGILADAMERATVLASGTRRRANVLMAPFAGLERVDSAGPAMRELETMVGLSKAQKAQGWRIALVAQVGTVSAEEAALDGFDDALCRKLGANLLALRSERIQPGVNQEEKAPAQYHERQAMDVPDRLAFMAGRAGYNGFAHWTGLERQQAKDLLILDRIDPLTDQGKERLRAVPPRAGARDRSGRRQPAPVGRPADRQGPVPQRRPRQEGLRPGRPAHLRRRPVP
ncbi:MAG: hypothetical protein H6742_17220 [Alphaproteobacteria bacterium]|nr:hypothetical protein [Alphaproteobacteria bacterium]